VQLAADANVLLAAAGGHAAKKVFFDVPGVRVFSTDHVLDETRAYVPEFSESYSLDPDQVVRALGTLGVKALPRVVYESRIPEASRRIGGRDPDDVELLALAIALRVPIWSNDNVFRRARHEWYTTARLLAKLGLHGRRRS